MLAANLLACLLACLVACLLSCLLANLRDFWFALLTCLLATWFALLTCVLAPLLVHMLLCLPCVLSCLLPTKLTYKTLQLAVYPFLSASANQLQLSKNINWMKSFYGVWQDRGANFYGYLPGAANENWHFGATRVWARPVRRQKYST